MYRVKTPRPEKIRSDKRFAWFPKTFKLEDGRLLFIFLEHYRKIFINRSRATWDRDKCYYVIEVGDERYNYEEYR